MNSLWAQLKSCCNKFDQYWSLSINGKKFGISLILLNFALWLVQKTHAILSSKLMQNSHQSQLGHPCFPVLQLVCFFSLWFLIGCSGYFPLFWLVAVNTLILVFQHSIEKRSKMSSQSEGQRFNSYREWDFILCSTLVERQKTSLLYSHVIPENNAQRALSQHYGKNYFLHTTLA